MHRLLVPALVLTLSTMALAEPVEVFIFSGQSNMVGSGQLTDLTEAQRAPIPRARYWNGHEFEIYVPGTTVTSANENRFGPELAFARHYPEATEERPIYLIKYAVGGRPLHRGFHGGQWRGSEPSPGRENFYPGEFPEDPNTGTLYKKLLTRVTAALAHLQAQGIEYRIRGILWMQGEADAKHEVSAREYAARLKQWHQRLLADIDAFPCPLVYGQVLPHSPAKERYTHRDEVRQSQAQLHRESGHLDSYTWAFMIPTEPMELSTDTVHYTSTGQLRLGRIFAETLAEQVADLRQKSE